MRGLLAAIDHGPSRAEVTAERALLAALGGTCHSPVAMLSKAEDGTIAMRAALFSADGAARIERSAAFALDDDAGAERLAHELLNDCDPTIASLFGVPQP